MIDADEKKAVLNRLKRAHGQLAAIITMLEDDRDCEEVVNQLIACSSAVKRAGIKVVACGMRSSAANSDGSDDRLERLLMSLA